MNDFISVISGLLTLILIVFIAYIARKYLGKKTVVFSQGKEMRLLDSLSLGPDRRLFIVEADGERFLISSDNQGIHLISGLRGKEISPGQGFEDELNEELKR